MFLLIFKKKKSIHASIVTRPHKHTYTHEQTYQNAYVLRNEKYKTQSNKEKKIFKLTKIIDNLYINIDCF